MARMLRSSETEKKSVQASKSCTKAQREAVQVGADHEQEDRQFDGVVSAHRFPVIVAFPDGVDDVPVRLARAGGFYK